MTLRPALALGGAVLLAVSLAGCVDSDRSSSGGGGGGDEASGGDCPWDADDSIEASAVIGYQAIPNGDLVVKDQGVLEACMPNASIKWTNFPSGGDVVQAFGGDNLDIGLAGSSPSTIALSAPLELPVSVVWIHDVIGEAESLVVRDTSITDITGLEGKTIAVPFSSTAHYSLLQALADAGMDSAKDVTIINLEPEKMQAAWDGGDIDAAWVWDPSLSALEKDGQIILSSADTAEAGKPTYDLGLASNAFVEENPEFMMQWAKAQDWAVTMLNDDPDAAAESIAVELSLDSTDAAKALFDGLTYLNAEEQASADWLGGKLGQDLLTTAKFLYEQGEIEKVGTEQQYADGVDPGPAQEAAQG
jgi:taurine transport system substrate-binding protein